MLSCCLTGRMDSSPSAQNDTLSLEWASGSVFFAVVCVVDVAGFEADDLPLAEAPVIDAGIAVFAADAACAVGAFEVGARGDDGGVAVDADFEVVDIERGDVQGAGAAQSERFGLGFDGAAGADADVV